MRPERVAVVGGGIMGTGIAALFANQRIPVTVFEVTPELARKALERLQAEGQKLPELTSPRNAKYVSASTVDRYPDELAAHDLIIEVVPEVMSLKQKVFAAIDAHRRPGSVVATNTSGLSVEAMAEGRSDDFRAHFLGTHFFNPVRHMPLVELIPTRATRPDIVDGYAAFFRGLGKTPVVGRDTPNFIANRVGVYQILKVMRLAAKYRLTVEQVDMITGPPLGNPKTASFRLSDMVGLDTLLHAARNSYEHCREDEARADLEPPQLLVDLVAKGRLGEKSGEGFFKKVGKGEILALDLETLEYRPQTSPRSDVVRVAKTYARAADRVRVMVGCDPAPGVGGDDPATLFARELVLATGAYALERVGEVADDIETIDVAMRAGFGRELGPIEALDAIGLERAARLMEEARIPVPALLRQAIAAAGPRTPRFYRKDGEGRRTYFDPREKGGWRTVPDDPRVLSLPRLRAAGGVVRENLNARLIDLGDGVLLCELDVKMVPAMNPVDDYVMAMMAQAHEEVGAGRFRALVIGNQAPNFCAGANLKAVLALAEVGAWDTIRRMSATLQRLNMANLHAPYPVVVAPHGMTLGGGLEIALGGQVRVAASELYCGLVEVGVGLIPAGGGCLRLLQLREQLRNARGGSFGPMQNALAAFDLIGFGKVSGSAQDAREKGLLAKDDVIVAARDELIARAREVALARLEGFQPIAPLPVHLPGRGGYLVMQDTIDGMVRAGAISAHAARIAKVQARILTGGPEANPTEPVSEETILEMEREGFVELCQEPLTRARMAHMLKTGKPLLN